MKKQRYTLLSCDKMEDKKTLPFFFFSTIKYFEKLIFKTIKTQEPMLQIAYYIRLKDICQKELDLLVMTNNKKKIFGILDNIDKNRKINDEF